MSSTTHRRETINLDRYLLREPRYPALYCPFCDANAEECIDESHVGHYMTYREKAMDEAEAAQYDQWTDKL